MKKSDLKKLIKPLVKECIHEVLLEEGLLSNVVAEVAKGMQNNLVVESVPAPRRTQSKQEVVAKNDEARQKLAEHRKKMLNAVGQDAYNGVDIFEGTTPTREPNKQQSSTDLGDPNDAGVDISSLVGGASQIWRAMK
jgi:hypothetical protein